MAISNLQPEDELSIDEAVNALRKAGSGFGTGFLRALTTSQPLLARHKVSPTQNQTPKGMLKKWDKHPVSKYRRDKQTLGIPTHRRRNGVAFDRIETMQLLWKVYFNGCTTPVNYIFKVGFVREHPRHAVWEEKLTLQTAKLNSLLAKLGWGEFISSVQRQPHAVQEVQKALDTWLKLGSTVLYYSVKQEAFRKAIVTQIRQSGVRIDFAQQSEDRRRHIPFKMVLQYLEPVTKTEIWSA